LPAVSLNGTGLMVGVFARWLDISLWSVVFSDGFVRLKFSAPSN